MSTITSASAEIRAPSRAVLNLARLPRDVARWTWPEALLGELSGERELPDGAFQRSNSAGDRFRDRVLDFAERKARIENALLPKEKGVPGRTLILELIVEPRGGACLATLSVAFADREAPTAPTEVRRWRRHAEQCLARLAALCEVADAPVPDEVEAAAEA